MGPRHICLVTETFPPEINGVANTLDNLCRELRFQWSVNERQLAVLYVGRLAAEKNLAQAISTSERLKLIHAGARFILVGMGHSGRNSSTRTRTTCSAVSKRGGPGAALCVSGYLPVSQPVRNVR